MKHKSAVYIAQTKTDFWGNNLNEIYVILQDWFYAELKLKKKLGVQCYDRIAFQTQYGTCQIMSRLFFSLSSSYCLFSVFISPKSNHCLPLSLAFEADGDKYIMMKCMPITFLFIPSWAPEAQSETPARPCRQYAGFGLVMMMMRRRRRRRRSRMRRMILVSTIRFCNTHMEGFAWKIVDCGQALL